MVLNKRLRVILKNKWTLILGSILLCAVSVAFFVISSASGAALETTLDDFLTDANVEDAYFMTASPLTDEEIDSLIRDYNVDIEVVSYYDYELNSKTLRIFKESERINGYVIKEGAAIQNQTEMLINDSFAESSNIHIGETYRINDIEYSIVGYFTRPDYLTPVKNSSDSVVGEDFGIAIVSQSDFSTFTPSIDYYSIIYNQDNSLKVREFLNENYTITNYVSRENNNRINTAIVQADSVSQMAFMYGPFLFLLTAAFVIIIISKVLKQEKKEIGILTALGYSKKELVNFYSKLALFISLIGGIIGIVIGQLLAFPITDFYASINNTPNIETKQLFNIPILVIGLLIPILLLWITANIVVRRYLNKDVISLLRNMNETKARKIYFLRGVKLSSSVKYSIRSLLRNRGRSIVFILGIFIAASITLIGMIMRTSVNYVIDNELQQNYGYEYTYYLNSYQTDELKSGEGIISLSWEYKESGSAINVMGISKNSDYFQLRTVDGDSLDLNNKFYISRVVAETLNKKAGDTIMLINPTTTEEFEIEIGGIVNLNKLKAVYGSIENVSALVGNNQISYNAIISSEKLNIDKSILAQTIRNSDFVESFKTTVSSSVLSVVNILVLLGIVIGIIVIYMITSMTVEENQYNISTLKVLGYKTREISKMMFRMNKYLVLGFFLLAIPVMLKLCEAQFLAEADSLNMVIPAIINPIDILLGFIFIFASYYMALFITRSRIMKIDLVESLKESRE